MSSYSFRGGGTTNLSSFGGGRINTDDDNNEFEPLKSVNDGGNPSTFDISYRPHHHHHHPNQSQQQQLDDTFEDEEDGHKFLLWNNPIEEADYLFGGGSKTNNNNNSSSIIDPLERDARDAIRERIIFRKLMVSIPSLATIGMNIFAIIYTFLIAAEGPASPIGGILVLVAGTIGSLLSLEIFITEVFVVDDIQTLVEFDQREVLLLKAKQGQLISKEKQLQLNVFCLKEDERRLISEMNDPHKGRKYLQGVVKKYKKQLVQKTDAYRQYLIADVMNLIIRADKDESGDFDDSEIKHLIRYIKALPTVKVNEKKLSKAIKKERSLYSVLSLVQDLSSSSSSSSANKSKSKKVLPAKKRIFTFDDKQVELQVIELSKKHERETIMISKPSTSSTKPKSSSSSSSRGRSKSPKSTKNSIINNDDGGTNNKRRLSKKKKKSKKRSLSPNSSKLGGSGSNGGDDDDDSRIGELTQPIGSGGFGPSGSTSRSKSPTTKLTGVFSGGGASSSNSSSSSGRKISKSRSLSPPPKDQRSGGGRSASPLGLKSVKKGIATFLSSTNKPKKDEDINNNKKSQKGGSKGDTLSSFF